MDNKILFSFFWKFAERCGAQFVSLAVSIILARLLLPEDYGTVALIAVFMNILQVFVDSGLGNALIQKKDADELDFSTVFFFNLIICVCLYMIMFMLAPIIAIFYKNDQLTILVRVVSISLLISGVKNVQHAYVSKKMMFKKFFYATLGGTIVSGCLGVFAAQKNLGVWALIIQQLSNLLIDTLILWLTVGWKPKVQFSISRLKKLFSYGWKLLLSAILDTGYNNMRALMIGRVYSASDLGYYNKGQQIPSLIVNNINTSFDAVLLPAISEEQDDIVRVRQITRYSIQISTFIMAPMFIGIAVLAVPIVRFVLTDKWLPCVPILRVFCITYMFYPIHTANLNAVKALGRSDIFLKLEIAKKIFGLVLLFITVHISVMAMVYSLIFNCLFSMVVNSRPNAILLKYSFREQLGDICPSLGCALFMGGIVYMFSLLSFPDLITIIVGVVLGGGIYLGGARAIQLNVLFWGLDMFKKSISRK